ncbi:tripartite tricarboxylate transporter substrate-binding protein [Devosia sp. 2618]|uniref:Bug family tripartite tricarboxylate transporter substrate binding protein n=1 Tax=Devosia sp. 2618 TaxID=3156454 RepID=UPI0033917B4B
MAKFNPKGVAEASRNGYTWSLKTMRLTAAIIGGARMTSLRRYATRLVAGAIFALGLAGNARADISFSGETIDWIIPFAETGGSDTWARFNAPFLARHLPGNPEIRVINESGGGGTRGPNIFAGRTRADGLTILGTSGSTQFPYLLGDLRVRYDYSDWEPVMVAPTGGVVYVSAETGISSFEDVAKLGDQRLVFASQGPTSLDLVPMLAFRLLGFDVHYVFGYTGRGDGLVAMDRGEVNIDYQTTASFLRNVAPTVDAGEAIPLMTWGILDEHGQMQRDPTFPDLPIVEEVYQALHGRVPAGPAYESYRAFNIAGFAAQKMVVLRNDTPEEIIEVWRQAWRDTFEDPEYIDSVKSILGEYEQVTDRGAQTLFTAGTTIEPKVRHLVLDMLSREYAVRLKK